MKDNAMEMAALAERCAKATGPDRELEEEAHVALGWYQRRVTRLGLNGRTPGSYLWFPPNPTRTPKGRSRLPSVAEPRVRARLAVALRALSLSRSSAGGEMDRG